MASESGYDQSPWALTVPGFNLRWGLPILVPPSSTRLPSVAVLGCGVVLPPVFCPGRASLPVTLEARVSSSPSLGLAAALILSSDSDHHI